MSRPLYLLHGFAGSSESWLAIGPDLERACLPVGIDLPGHGRNAQEGSIESAADALARAFDGPRADLLGYSLGARVALRVAVCHPEVVGRLILESPSAGITDPAERAARRAADEALADRIEEAGIEAFVDEWERNPVFASHASLDPAAAARQRAIRLAQDPDRLARSLRLAGQGAMQPLHDRLGEVTAPTLVIAGALDPARARAERVASGIPNARLAVVDGAGHTPHLERPDAFVALVTDFLLEDLPA